MRSVSSVKNFVKSFWRRLRSPVAASTAPKPIERPFRVLVFDWDGTAVVDRRENASRLARSAEDLLTEQVWLVVVTATNLSNIDGQFCQLLPPPLPPSACWSAPTVAPRCTGLIALVNQCAVFCA